jgi:transposase
LWAGFGLFAGKFVCVRDAGGDADRPSYGELQALVVAQAARIAELERELAELRQQVGKNSRNSSKPPSSDGYSKAPAEKDRSLRRRSGRKPGGVEGHEGAYLKRSPVPDRRIVHEPEGCCEGCGRDLADAEEVGEEVRQVFDIPEEVALEVIEHAAKLYRCKGCGRTSAGVFPAQVSAPCQYGSSLRALGVYLHVFQHIPYDRARQAIFDLTRAEVSTATLKAWVDAAANGLTDFDEALRALLKRSPVVNFDETGARIAGRLQWVHSASTTTLTRYVAHQKRGVQAMEAAGVLPGFGGVAVHDGWKPYRAFTDTTHALCGAHHLRELQAAAEDGQGWASAMSCLLLDVHAAVEQAKTDGAKKLAKSALCDLRDCYRAVIALGYEENPGLAESAEQRIKRSDAENLLLRLDCQQADALRFAHDFRVPFTNNLAEADIRMVKLQQKISGCWRTPQGAERYLRIRSYISTARKQGQRPLAVLSQLAAGTAWTPAPG